MIQIYGLKHKFCAPFLQVPYEFLEHRIKFNCEKLTKKFGRLRRMFNISP